MKSPDTYAVAANALLYYNPDTNPTGSDNWQGSAVIRAAEDISVVVFNVGPNQVQSYNGVSRSGNSSDLSFGQSGLTLYGPAFYRNKWGYDSTVVIQNAGSSAANVQVTFKGRSGYSDGSAGNTLAVNESWRLTGPINNWVGSLIISSQNGVPLAATVYEQHQTSAVARGYNSSLGGRSVLFLPAAYKNKWNMTTGIVVQNVHSSQSATVRLHFYDRQGNFTTSVDLTNLGSGQAQGVWLGNVGGLGSSWTGWVKVESLNGQPVSVAVNTSRPTDHYDHTGAGLAGRSILFPFAAKSANGHTSGYTIVNPGTGQVGVEATYYDASGGTTYTENYTIPGQGVVGRYQGNDPLPNGWVGSIVLEADGPLLGVMREDSAQTTSAYNGLVR